MGVDGLRVLLVEDDARVREVLKAFLEVDGIEVILAADGVEGLERAEAERPDLIVTDVMMPRMDGLTMLDRLRAAEELHHVPVLLISGHAIPSDRIQADPKHVAHLGKPVSLGGFLAAVRRLHRAATTA